MIKLNLLKRNIKGGNTEIIKMTSIDDEWNRFKSDAFNGVKRKRDTLVNIDNELPIEAPICSDLHISTKTVIAVLNQQIDLEDLFWKIETIKYWMPKEGILKKEKLFQFSSPDELKIYQKPLSDYNYYVENIIKHVDDPTSSKICFFDKRKLTVGLGSKEILNTRIKNTGIIFNSISMSFRVYCEETHTFHETHVKLFNTGKLELPGVANVSLLSLIKQKIIEFLKPYISPNIDYINKHKRGVLINSNFICGYYIDRDNANNIFKEKYGLVSDFDPSHYPGVKIKYYYNNDLPMDHSVQTGRVDDENRIKVSNLEKLSKYTRISIAVFRTGSCLVSGNCSDEQLIFVYNFAKQVFKDDYLQLRVPTKMAFEIKQKKKTKLRHKYIKLFSNNLNMKLYDVSE